LSSALPDGANGTDGTNGTNGTNGANGATGTNGANGSNGSNGVTGATGSNTIGGAAALFGNEHGTTSGDCISNSANFAHSPAPGCPTTAQGDYVYTEGPVPAAGGSISNLQAQAGSAAAPKKSSLVNVIDETPAGVQKVAMTCKINAGETTCSNMSMVGIAAGHYLMVRIDTTASATTWRVTFRY
jgi:hypothetical protein